MAVKIDCVHCGNQMQTILEEEIVMLTAISFDGSAIFRKVTLYFCITCKEYYHIISNSFRSKRLR